MWKLVTCKAKDRGGSEDRSCTIDNGCIELVERCRYVTGGMEFDLTPLPSTTDVSFVYNTPTPFVSRSTNPSTMHYLLGQWMALFNFCLCKNNKINNSLLLFRDTCFIKININKIVVRMLHKCGNWLRARPRIVVGAKIDRAPSTTVVLSWLSVAGTSQEVWSLI